MIKPIGLTNTLLNPDNLNETIKYPEDFIVLEHAKYGSLHEVISYTKCFSEVTAFAVFSQIVDAVRQVHMRGVAHMDIKENNILISHCEENRNNPLTGYLPIKFKLADFGISVTTQNMTPSRVSTHSINNI